LAHLKPPMPLQVPVPQQELAMRQASARPQPALLPLAQVRPS
jgi:hypothetical protein